MLGASWATQYPRFRDCGAYLCSTSPNPRTLQLEASCSLGKLICVDVRCKTQRDVEFLPWICRIEVLKRLHQLKYWPSSRIIGTAFMGFE